MTRRSYLFVILTLALASCQAPQDGTPEPATLTPEATAIPTQEPESPMPPAPFAVQPPAGEVVFDFAGAMCSARWTNNGQELPCPGDPAQVEPGSVQRLDAGTLRGGMAFEEVTLLTIPAHDAQFQGIFGAYPVYAVQPGDHFRAMLACLDGMPCQSDFELAYYDASGGFHTLGEVAAAEVIGGMYLLDVHLAALAGQEVRLVLVVRDADNQPVGSRALWMAPVLWRDPNPPPTVPAPTSAEIPGVLAGTVDMGSAPPYLNDPVVGPSAVVVMAFNRDDGTWWWFQNTAMRPAFQMTVPPGRYHLVAYGYGVAGEPYVTAGYTGLSPSCGQPLAELSVGSNAHLTGLVIADWNWQCGGTAYRPPKPDEVPLP